MKKLLFLLFLLPTQHTQSFNIKWLVSIVTKYFKPQQKTLKECRTMQEIIANAHSKEAIAELNKRNITETQIMNMKEFKTFPLPKMIEILQGLRKEKLSQQEINKLIDRLKTKISHEEFETITKKLKNETNRCSQKEFDEFINSLQQRNP